MPPLICAACVTAVSATWTDGAEADGLANVGETVTHTFRLFNGGTTTLEGVCVTDESFSDACVDCLTADDGELAPGDDVTCSAISLVSVRPTIRESTPSTSSSRLIILSTIAQNISRLMESDFFVDLQRLYVLLKYQG